MRHPGFIKPERIANIDSEIQILDTHKSLKTGFNIEFAACMTQFNRTLLTPTMVINIDALLKNADAAMYQAKEDGRNNYRFFRPHEPV